MEEKREGREGRSQSEQTSRGGGPVGARPERGAGTRRARPERRGRSGRTWEEEGFAPVVQPRHLAHALRGACQLELGQHVDLQRGVHAKA